MGALGTRLLLTAGGELNGRPLKSPRVLARVPGVDLPPPPDRVQGVKNEIVENSPSKKTLPLHRLSVAGRPSGGVLQAFSGFFFGFSSLNQHRDGHDRRIYQFANGVSGNLLLPSTKTVVKSHKIA